MPRYPACFRPRAGHALLLAGLLALLGAACSDAAPQLTAPAATSSSTEPGTRAQAVLAPDLTVTLFDGSVFNLGEHLSRDGRPVLLHLWGAECAACLEQMPVIDEAARRHPEVLFLGVAVEDDLEAAAACAAEEEVSYPLGADRDGTVAAAFPCPELPAAFLIGSDGTLLGSVYGGLSAADVEALVTDHLTG